jgi:chromate transporter
MTSRPGLATLGWQMLKEANRTLGGGMPAIELIRRSFTRRGWLDDTRHGLLVAVSRFTPGTNLLAYCAGLGWGIGGIGGMVVALLGASIPGSLAVTLLSAVISRLVESPGVRAALAVAMLAAAALILSSAWALVRPYVLGARPVWALAITVGAAVLFAAGIPPVRVLLVAAIFGAVSPAPKDAP